VFRNDILFIAVYVDDILICRSDKNKILNLKIKLSNHFKMTDCRMCKHYLKMLVTQNKTLQILILSQRIYFTEMLKDFSLQNVKTVITSMKLRIYLIKTIRTAESELITQYQKIIKSFMYIMTQTQLNITYIMLTLNQFAHNSNNTH